LSTRSYCNHKQPVKICPQITQATADCVCTCHVGAGLAVGETVVERPDLTPRTHDLRHLLWVLRIDPTKAAAQSVTISSPLFPLLRFCLRVKVKNARSRKSAVSSAKAPEGLPDTSRTLAPVSVGPRRHCHTGSGQTPITTSNLSGKASKSRSTCESTVVFSPAKSRALSPSCVCKVRR